MKKKKNGLLMFCSLLLGMSMLTACGTSEKQELTTEMTETTEVTTEETTEATTEEVVEESLFKTIKGMYLFTSGVGGWGTEMEINEDGTFSGTYHDSDMGDVGEEYPNGTVYQSEFSGTFSEPEMIDEYTYSMTMESLTLKNTAGEEEIIDGVKYVYSDPYGLDDAEVFEVYLPGKPMAELSEEYISWAYIKFWGEDIPETLDFYGIYNVNGQEGFVQEEIEEESEEESEVTESENTDENVDLSKFLELGGDYSGQDIETLRISIYTDGLSDEEIGCYDFEYYDITHGLVYYRDGEYQLVSDLGQKSIMEFISWESENIQFRLIGEDGADMGIFQMTSHYVP